MSRWGRGRGASVAVPLEHLFRENSNCPSAARSTATVGKWGITSFTSTRSAPYSFLGADVGYQKKPKQDQNSPLTVPALESNTPPPKPKKFFKSRNVDPSENAALPTSSVAPQPAPSPSHTAYPTPTFSKKDDKPLKPVSFSKKSPKHQELKKTAVADKMEIPKLKIHVDRSTKSSKGKFFATKAPVAKKEEPTPVEEKTHLSPNKRYLVRNRDKVINYSEERSNSPPPAVLPPPFQVTIPTRVSTPKVSPAPAASPTYVKPGLMSPTNKDGKPPIVLRISKGTSRLLSTDSEDIVTSPNADRHSFSDHCTETEEGKPPDPKPSASPAAKQESLKITIKCFGGGKDKSSKSKSEKSGHKLEIVTSDSDKDKDKDNGHTRSTRASRRNQHKEDDLGRVASPTPGSDNYELYRTLTSPQATPLRSPQLTPSRHEPSIQDDHHMDNDVEMTLAQLDSGKPVDIPASPKNGIQNMKSPITIDSQDHPGGRAMRHRANINYNENVNSYIDDITARFNKNPAKSYSRKSKKKLDLAPPPPENISVPTPPPSEAVTQLPEPIPKLSPESLSSARTESEVTPPEETAIVGQTLPAESVVESDPVINKNNKTPDDSLEDEHIEPEESSEVIEDAEMDKVSERLADLDKHTFKSPKRLIVEGSPTQGDLEEKPSVKLVITKKKGSIFKSRSLVNDGPGAAGKKRHLYKHKWADDGKGGQTPRPEPEPSAQAALQEFEESRSMLTRVTRYQKDKNPSIEDEIEPYTSVKCPKNAKDYYTVVRNVKKAHQMQEIGEFQEFNDDVEYILDALQDNNPMSTRCLSAITLASKCTAPAFRMHVRAHGTVAKFFRALHDATNDQSLGLCTATVMFVLSQDRLNMDLDRESLELMLNLLESDVSHKDALDDCGLTSVQLAKNKERVRELCAEIKSQGKAKHLDLDNITVGHLAMETLLSLTSKRAGEWFKEELRVLGGVEHILSTICDCCATIGDYGVEWSPLLLDLLRKVDRCMRVLENVTQQNEENQTYLVNWKGGLAVDTLVRLFRLCDREIPLYPTCGGHHATGATVRDALLPTLKVLINLTHPFNSNSIGSAVIGERPGIIDASLHLLLQAPNYIPEQSNFEFSVCVLLLLINLMQNNAANINLLMEAKAPADHEAVFTCNKPALQALIDHFYKREELARLAEKNTDAILDGEKVKEDEPKEKKKKSADECMDETVEKLLQKAGTHMEHTMVGSYVVLLLGHVTMESAEHEARVRNLLPNASFCEMLVVLHKYYSFLNLTASSEAASVAHVKGTEKIINFLEKSDKAYAARNVEPGTSKPSGYSDGASPSSSNQDKDSAINYSNLDIINNSNMTNEYTSESDKLSSSVDMDTSFN